MYLIQQWKERKYYFDKELHVLRAGRAQFFAKFTVFYVLYSKKTEFFPDLCAARSEEDMH